MKKEKRTVKIVSFVILAVVCVIWIFPMVWAILTSFKSEMEIQGAGFHLMPQDWTLDNYIQLVNNDSSPVLRWFTNSLIISAGHMVLVLIVVSMAAYGYTRLNFKGRNFIFGCLLANDDVSKRYESDSKL